MTTLNKILSFLNAQPDFRNARTPISKHLKLPELVVKHHLSALISGGLVGRMAGFEDGDIYYLTSEGRDAAENINPELSLS